MKRLRFCVDRSELVHQKFLDYVLFSCWLGYIVSDLSTLAQSFSPYCTYMMKSFEEAKHRSKDFYLKEVGGS